MVLPVDDQTLQQVWSAQERAVHRRHATQGDMIPTPRTGMSSIQHEFFGPQATLSGLGVDTFSDLCELIPITRGMDINLDHSRIRRYLQDLDTTV